MKITVGIDYSQFMSEVLEGIVLVQGLRVVKKCRQYTFRTKNVLIVVK